MMFQRRFAKCLVAAPLACSPWLMARTSRQDARCQSHSRDPLHHLDANLQRKGQSAGEPAAPTTQSAQVVNPLHHLDPNLQKRGRSEHVLAKRPGHTHVVRIALTGGPCAGKSSALETIIESAKKEGFDVYCAPEVATLIFNSGFGFPKTDDEVLTLQLGLARMQLQMERSFTAIAAKTGRPSIIVFDRGMLDGKCYMKDDQWEEVMNQIGGGDSDGQTTGVTKEYLDARYDAVVHMVTAADGAAEFYRWGKCTDDRGVSVTRWEDPQKAIELDQRMRECWAGHPNHIIIHNRELEGGFREKLARVSEAVLRTAKSKWV